MILGGETRLEVVGESFYEDNFHAVTRGKKRGSNGIDVVAVLEAEPTNPYDSNAVAVKVDGLKVGHLSKHMAAKYRAQVIQLTTIHGRPIALRGHIGRGSEYFTISLDHDPRDFAV